MSTLTTRLLEHATDTEWYLTALPATEPSSLESAREAYARVADALAAGHVQILQERILALRSERAKILQIRREAFERRGVDPSVPVTFLQGTPAAGGPFAGLRIWGVAPSKPGDNVVHTVRHRGSPIGRRFAGEGFRMLALAAVDGVSADGTRPSCASRQAQDMFVNVGALLAANDHGFRQVVRTWIYMARILDWYGEFNRVRTAHYAKEGLLLSNSPIFPASTGIQAQSDDEECVMDVLAVDAQHGGPVRIKPVLRSSRQKQAFCYGSAFSRATVVERAGRKTMHISGTASIDNAGRSVHLEDPEAQTTDTLLSIAALLEDEGASLQDICQAVVYCKNAAAFEAWRSVTRRLRLPEIPAVCVVADVCRPELLIEIEAIAIF